MIYRKAVWSRDSYKMIEVLGCIGLETTTRVPHKSHIINPRRTCAARVTVVGLCVCLSTNILALQATRRLMSDTNSFSATRA